MYNESLKIREEIEDKKLSRSLAEAYFQIGNAYLYENKAISEVSALVYYKKAQKIIENNICQMMNYDELRSDQRAEGLFDLPKIKDLK